MRIPRLEPGSIFRLLPHLPRSRRARAVDCPHKKPAKCRIKFLIHGEGKRGKAQCDFLLPAMMQDTLIVQSFGIIRSCHVCLATAFLEVTTGEYYLPGKAGMNDSCRSSHQPAQKIEIMCTKPSINPTERVILVIKAL